MGIETNIENQPTYDMGDNTLTNATGDNVTTANQPVNADVIVTEPSFNNDEETPAQDESDPIMVAMQSAAAAMEAATKSVAEAIAAMSYSRTQIDPAEVGSDADQ